MSPQADAEALVAKILDPDLRGELYPLYHALRRGAPVHQDESLLERRAWILRTMTGFEDWSQKPSRPGRWTIGPLPDPTGR